MEHMAEDRNNAETNDLDARLTAYYGIPTTGQPLSSGDWETLRCQLGPQNRPKERRRHGSSWHELRGLHRSGARRVAMPSLIQESLGRVISEARWNQHMPPIHCSIRSTVREPRLHVTPFLLLGRPSLRVVLPIDAPITLQQVEIDVLLAAGLARFLLMSRFADRMLRHALACLLLLGCLIALYGVDRHQFHFILPISIIVVGTVLLWMYQQRRYAFHADTIAVQWLGRSRVCEGLRELARRSRRPHWLRWSEPSLEARMKRVCGTRVASRDRDLTLVG